MNLTDDNLNTEVNNDGEIVIEPSYVGYLRSHGYAVDGVKDVRAIDGSDDDHLVCKVKTYLYPQNDGRLDIATHGVWLPTCSCWGFRQSSADVSNPDTMPVDGETCPHIKAAYKVEKAKADDSQETLV